MSVRPRSRDDAEPFTTLDGSEVRELMHPAAGGSIAQSLAEATVAPGASTRRHRHRRTEELYHIVAGVGRMQLDGSAFEVTPGDTVRIPPGAVHCIHISGAVDLVFLCCCSPPYADEDTEVID